MTLVLYIIIYIKDKIKDKKQRGLKRLNLKELAKIAGVSPSTVSLVLNNKKGVGNETRKRVLDIIEKYNYTSPKKSAALSKSILFLKYIKHGMIVEENAGFISSIIDSIENDCRHEGYSLSIVNSEDCLERTLQSIDFSAYQGLILLGTELDSCSYSMLTAIPIPYVVIDNIMPNFNCNCIAINNEEIVYHALSYLVTLGHKDVAYFHSSIRIQNFDERADAFRKYAKELELNFNPEHEFLLEPTLLGAYDSMKKYLSKGVKLPSAVFADNDTIAIGAIKALKEYKIKIPNDVSIIGLDDIPFSAINSPALTTMNVPKRLMGSVALRHLHMAIEDPSFRNIKARIGGTIVPRDSTKALK